MERKRERERQVERVVPSVRPDWVGGGPILALSVAVVRERGVKVDITKTRDDSYRSVCPPIHETH